MVSGILDIMTRGATHAADLIIQAYERTLRELAERPEIILCIVLRINHLICQLNVNKGEGTPVITTKVLGSWRNGVPFFNSDRLIDEAHPSIELAEEYLRIGIVTSSRGNKY